MTDNLRELYKAYSGKDILKEEGLSSSGSNRKYFRITGSDGLSVIGVEGLSRKENEAFVYLSSHFREKGLPVPEVLAVSSDGMAYLQEDLGDVQLYAVISKGRDAGIYSSEEKGLLLETISLLPRIQFEGAEGLDFSRCYPEPCFSRRLVMFDLNYFKYCFLKASGVEFDEVLLQDDFDRLCNDLMEDDTNTFMYRDFQARNVMLKDGKPYFIDFQDGRRGPVYYDVASFVWQARAQYPEDLRNELVGEYLKGLRQYVPDLDELHFKARLDLFVLFRTLQVLGAYGFRGYFERKPHFIESVPYAISNLKVLLSEVGFNSYRYLSEVLGSLVNRYPASDGQHIMNPAGKVADIRPENRLTVKIFSFSYKKGIPADDSGNGGGYVFDCRAVHNPGRYEYYRAFTGLDPEVIRFLEDDGEITKFLSHVYALADAHVERYLERGFTSLQIAFGCTGGQHRSVYSAEHTAAHLHSRYGVSITVIHRELGIEKKI